MSITFSPCSHQCLLLFFFIIEILTGTRWNLNVILICISLIARDIEHFFTFVVHLYSFEKCLFSFSAHLLIRLFVFLYCLLSSLYILNIDFLSGEEVAKDLLSFHRLSLHCLIFSFAVQKLFNLMPSHLLILVLFLAL